MPPANASSEIVPAGGMTELFLGGSAKETKLIVCFLPDRSTAGGHAAPPREAGPGSGSYPAGRLPTDGHERLYREATGGPAVPTTESATGALDTAAAEGWVALPHRWASRWPSAALPRSGAAPSDPAAGQSSPPREREEMVHGMTKVLPVGKRLTLLSEAPIRRIYIEKNARTLESYAMMLVDLEAEAE